ncbi:hypothetical protein BDZ90DRAFT_228912 [Jaminaea rosea]|uniref:Uncharacterized protein n=1 Tax=Jaminaea rosea TaxID=1569628 RepID=A0A316UJI5_9BASI|nr:hypothetical protein BDZ90DRAFT_228912 [Jaminaea rosea]PWN24501.1 hypothetical protein BDZ90DRAFT_228912 [Jaminaea rosea]
MLTISSPLTLASLSSTKKAMLSRIMRTLNFRWPPNIDKIETECRLRKVKWGCDDLKYIGTKAKQERTTFSAAAPRPYWVLDTMRRLWETKVRYEDICTCEPNQQVYVKYMGEEILDNVAQLIAWERRGGTYADEEAAEREQQPQKKNTSGQEKKQSGKKKKKGKTGSSSK